MAVRHLLVTGGSGYIGTALVEAALAGGTAVTVLGRHDLAARRRRRQIRWGLGEPVPDAAFATDGDFPAVDAIVHLAHDWTDDREDEANGNIAGTGLLLEAARRHGARLVFASSVSAWSGALNRYGRIKYRIEGMLRGPGETAARIGMVYGGPARAQWGMLCRITGLGPLLPMLETARPVQPIHLDDLCSGLLRLAAREAGGRAVWGLAASRPIPFGAVLAAIARHRHGKRLIVIDIPLGAALAAVTLAAKIPGLPRIDRERVLGLAGLPVIDTADSLAELGLTLRSLEDGLGPTPAEDRRALLNEGWALLRYVLGREPPAWATRRYVRALAAEGRTRPLPLAAAVRRWPPLLRALEPLEDSPLTQRLYLATLIAEAGPAASMVFHDHAGRPLPALLASLAATAAIEALCLPLRLLAGLGRR